MSRAKCGMVCAMRCVCFFDVSDVLRSRLQNQGPGPPQSILQKNAQAFLQFILRFCFTNNRVKLNGKNIFSRATINSARLKLSQSLSAAALCLPRLLCSPVRRAGEDEGRGTLQPAALFYGDIFQREFK